MTIPRRRRTAIAVATTSILALTATAGAAAARPGPGGTQGFEQAVSVKKIDRHLAALQAIADEYGDRAAGTAGHEASAAYVERVLHGAGYQTRRQHFPFLYFELLAPEVLHENAPTARDVATHVMTNSPATPDGGVSADLAAPANPLGCTAADWAGVNATGKIALVSRGTCPFVDKSRAAKAAGAVAAVVYNNGPGELNGTLGNDPSGAVPTTGVTQADGQALLAETQSGPVSMTLELRTVSETRQTFNVLAESAGGSADHVVMLGAHLDSVHEGPGINDNGSGTGTLLTVASELAKVDQKSLANKVRFAFWGAEESGLVGSTHYVNDLVAHDKPALGRIATYLNFDMIGSPNYIVAVYDADESTYDATAPIPPGSVETEKVLTDYFDAIGQPWVDYAYSGRSDYQAFINNGVAAGGLSSGSDGLKTPAQQALFGGTVGQQYDPSYHTPGDDYGNVNRTVLDIMSNAVAHATLAIARDLSLVTPGSSAQRSFRTTPVAPADGTVAR